MTKITDIREYIKKNIRNINNFPKKGVSFKDISPLFERPELIDRVIELFALECKDADVIVAPGARGFLFGPLLALEIRRPFVMIRKEGKLPGNTIGQEYNLEYGKSKIEMIIGQIKENQKVVIVDDVLATGGTVEAIQKLITKQKAEVIKSLCLIEIKELKGRNRLEKLGVNVYSIIKY